VDPISASVLGGIALSEGIKFLYGQVTELLKRRRDRADEAVGAPVVPAEQADLLDGPLTLRPVDAQVVTAHESKLKQLRRDLSDYADDMEPVDPANRQLIQQVNALRGLLELAYGQHLTFRGEQRPTTGSPLPAEAPAQVASYTANVTASGAGAVAVGRDATGAITTNNPGPAIAG
jgi:hypothetical protein